MPPPPSPSPAGARRSDLLPNEQEVSYDNLIEWLDRRKNWLIGLFGVAVLAVVGFVVWRLQTSKIENEAAVALTNARSLDSLQNVLQRFAGTRAAIFAAMTLADHLFDQGEWDRAAALYQTVLREGASSPLAPAAAFGMGAVEEARGNKENALRLYRSVAEARGAFAAPQAAYSAARLLERENRPIEARQAYEDLAARFPESASRMEALGRLERLKALLHQPASAAAAASIPPSAPSPLPAR